MFILLFILQGFQLGLDVGTDRVDVDARVNPTVNKYFTPNQKMFFLYSFIFLCQKSKVDIISINFFGGCNG